MQLKEIIHKKNYETDKMIDALVDEGEVLSRIYRIYESLRQVTLDFTRHWRDFASSEEVDEILEELYDLNIMIKSITGRTTQAQSIIDGLTKYLTE